jgi:hypothetical protein
MVLLPWADAAAFGVFGLLVKWLDGWDFQAKIGGIDKGLAEFLLLWVDFVDRIIRYCASM